MTDDFELELKQDFLEESSQLLEDTEQAFLDLEGQSDDQELMDRIFRLAHNLKGTSRAVGFGDIAEFTHEMESLILNIKDGKIEICDKIVTALLECNDHLNYMISTLKDDLDAKIDSTEMTEKLVKIMSGEATTIKAPGENVQQEKSEEEIEPVVTTETCSEKKQEEWDELDDLLASSSEEVKANVNEGSIEKEIPKEEATLLSVEKTEKEVSSNEGVLNIAQKSKNTKAKNIDETIRVSLSRVEELNNYVGELAIIQTMLSQNTSINTGDVAKKSLSQLNKLSKEIQDLAMRLRMMPIKNTFSKMQRIVRDTSKALGKQVKLHVIGEETEVDKTVLEQLADPLVHIIRNAVDHGIEENVQDRFSLGKPEMGNVYLNAFHEGNKLIIEISDDGKGIDPEVIKAKAVKRGILRQGQKITDEEVIQYVFHPGFSTKDEVSEISGRGVGMDVVMTNIKSISGEVLLESKVGKGSVFRIVLPLTLAIIDGMIVRIAGEKYVVPLNQVVETVHLSEEVRREVSGVGECLYLRGEVIPCFRLGKILNRSHEDSEDEKKIGIIVKNKDAHFSIIVDEILHQQQVVIKKIGQEIKKRKGFMGSSILGDGKPAIIVDLNEIVSGRLKKSNRQDYLNAA